MNPTTTNNETSYRAWAWTPPLFDDDGPVEREWRCNECQARVAWQDDAEQAEWEGQNWIAYGARCRDCRKWLGRRWVNAYEVDCLYGGPEEGGWWYDSGVPLASVPVESDEDEKTARELLERVLVSGKPRRNRHSVHGGSDIEIEVQDHIATAYPASRPVYE